MGVTTMARNVTGAGRADVNRSSTTRLHLLPLWHTDVSAHPATHEARSVKVALYARVSTDEQHVEQQRDLLIKLLFVIGR